MAGTVKDTDHGFDALIRRVFDVGRPVVQVGIFEAEGGEPHATKADLKAHARDARGRHVSKADALKGARSASLEGALTVAEVAAFNEFGLGVPERSFLRAYFDENRPRLLEMLAVLAKSVIAGKRTKAEALEVFGLKIQGEIQARIAAGISPANASSTIAKKGSSTPLIDTGQLPSTIAKKGSSTPLIDTGQLRSSITFRVDE